MKDKIRKLILDTSRILNNITTMMLFLSLFHDIQRCFSGDMLAVFGSLSAKITGVFLTEICGLI